MFTTIPKKALVALPDFSIVAPEQATVSAFDRSFHFGDSLYEVTRSYEGILFSLEEHMRRLSHSAKLALFEVMPDTDRIAAMTREACRAFFRKYGNTDVYVRITVSRGVGDLNIDRRGASEPYALVFVKEFEPHAQKYYDNGAHYAVVSRRRNHPDALDPAMKSGNYLNNILAMAEARARGADDALMLNYQGFVTEGTTNNVYAVKGNAVLTAPLSVGILAGITRDWIFQICESEGVELKEKLFTVSELEGCQEMFLSSATKEVMPITKLSGKPIGDGKPGPVTKKLHQALKRLIAQYCEKYRSQSLYL
ncbi:MAG: aminotransferase class IV [Bdellovibrionota bacterium]